MDNSNLEEKKDATTNEQIVENEDKVNETQEVPSDATLSETEKKETEEVAPTTSTAIVVKPTEKEEKPLELKYLDKQFILDVLSVPTCSKAEYRMITFIIMWARENNIKYEFDTYGNIYLTKGELNDGEYYPCVTSHLDTVQNQQTLYAQCGMPLPILERTNFKGNHELYVKGMGIGADDKAGVLISLSLFKYADKLKACFFLEEEIGCCGSKHLNKDWFKDVGYVIGWDSPDRNRAAFACSGELLMSKKLFNEIKDTCKEHGVTDFRSEPFTDVKEIRIQTNIECMNFGNGGYAAHMPTEYVVIEDMDGACGLGVALIKKLGTKSYQMKSKTYPYSAASYSQDEDIAFFGTNYDTKYSYTRTTYNTTPSKSTTTATKTTHQVSPTTQKDDGKIESHVFEYTISRYEKFISDIQLKVEEREAQILDDIKKVCDEKGYDYKEILDIFIEHSSAEPFSTAIEF